MSPDRHVRVYRCLTGLYPGRFRREYRDDLVAIFARQITEEGVARSWADTARDLAVSLPIQHLEAHMKRPPTTMIVAMCSMVAAGSTMLATLVGLSFFALLLLLVAASSIALAIGVGRAARVVSDPVELLRGWKKLLGGGMAILAGLIVLLNLPTVDEIDIKGLWHLMMLTLVTSFLMIIVGAIGAIASWLRSLRPAPRA